MSIKRSDIIMYTTHMSIFLEKSKTDIYRDGAWVIIARTYSELCPFMNSIYKGLVYMMVLNGSFSVIIGSVLPDNYYYKLRSENKSSPYTRLRELFIEAFKPHVSDIAKFGLHSLRSSGASAAANNGVPDRLFKCHGRWRRENAKDGYVQDDLNKRLKVSKS